MLERLAFAGAAAVAVLVGCGEPEDPPDPPLPLPSQDELYSADRVWDLEISLGPESLVRLRNDPRQYVPGLVRFRGHSFSDVGVRLKGGFSFQGLGGKAAFKIDFNQYDPDQRFIGLENITLNNMRQDRSFLHERLAYQVYLAHGLPAPRSGYVRLTVNGNLYGLYANVETVDDRFLRDHYADDSGNLYEAGINHDIVAEDVWEFEQDEGLDGSRQDLMAFVDWVSRDTDDVFFAEDSPLDTEQFLGFAAAEVVTGHWDGYHKPNNYRIYHEPAADSWTFIPWGTDQTWDRDVGAFDPGGVLLEKCFASPDCLVEYVRVATEVVETYDALALADEVDRVAAAIDGAALEDPRKPFVYEKYARHQAELRDYVAARADRLREQLDCVNGRVERDRDGDGYGACYADCDDSSAAALPGGVEVCDGLDNDCNGYVDDLTACPCEEVSVGDVEFLLCANALSWSRARSHCEGRGAVLARFDDAEQSAAVFAAARQRAAGRWYVGLNDRGEEKEWRWADGVAVDFDLWAPGDPDDFGDEDCGVLDPWADGAWTDVNCATALPYVCRKEDE